MSAQAAEVRERFTAESTNWGRLYDTDAVTSIYAANVRTRKSHAIELLGDVTGNVLDLGCGTGAVSAAIESRPDRTVFAADFSPAMLEAARISTGAAGHPAHVFAADGLAIPITTGAFNAVLALGVAEYTERPDRLVAECARILAPGGTLIVSLPNRTSPFIATDDAGKALKNFVTRRLVPGAARRWFKTRILGREDRAYFNHKRHRFAPEYVEALLAEHHFSVADRRFHTYGFGILDGFNWNLALSRRIERRITGNPSLERFGWTCILKAIRQ